MCAQMIIVLWPAPETGFKLFLIFLLSPQDLTIPESSTVKRVMTGTVAGFKWPPSVSEVRSLATSRIWVCGSKSRAFCLVVKQRDLIFLCQNILQHNKAEQYPRQFRNMLGSEISVSVELFVDSHLTCCTNFYTSCFKSISETDFPKLEMMWIVSPCLNTITWGDSFMVSFDFPHKQLLKTFRFCWINEWSVKQSKGSVIPG